MWNHCKLRCITTDDYVGLEKFFGHGAFSSHQDRSRQYLLGTSADHIQRLVPVDWQLQYCSAVAQRSSNPPIVCDRLCFLGHPIVFATGAYRCYRLCFLCHPIVLATGAYRCDRLCFLGHPIVLATGAYRCYQDAAIITPK
jgi:hypothetical protein